MNQIRKTFDALRCFISNGLVLICVVTILVALTQSTIAQNQFVPSNTDPDFGTWIPPNSMQPVYQNQNANLSGTNQASHIPIHDTGSFNANASVNSFPKTTTPFDTGIRTANLELPKPDAATASFEDQIDNAAATLSKWKDVASEKTSGWFDEMKTEGGWIAKIQSMFGSSGAGKMLGSLALVLGFYFGFVALMRKLNPNGSGELPAEVIEVMGQVPFGPRKNLQLVRLGSKMLLLLNGAEGTQPIGEITDPVEVDYLASLCPHKSQPAPSASLRRAIAQPFTQSPPPRLTGNSGSTVPSPSGLGNIGTTNLNDVIRILQQASKSHGTVFEA